MQSSSCKNTKKKEFNYIFFMSSAWVGTVLTVHLRIELNFSMQYNLFFIYKEGKGRGQRNLTKNKNYINYFRKTKSCNKFCIWFEHHGSWLENIKIFINIQYALKINASKVWTKMFLHRRKLTKKCFDFFFYFFRGF